MCSPARIRSRLIAALVAATLTGVVPGPRIRAQAPSTPAAVPTYRYRILGVFDEASGLPVEGAEVIDIASGTKALTTSTGTVSLIFLPDSGSLVRVRKIGYEVQTFPVAINQNETSPITLLLRPAITLPAVLVRDSAMTNLTPRLREFEEHRKAGFGRFIGEDVFRKSENMSMADLLMAHLPGVQPILLKTGATVLASTRVGCQGLALMSSCQSPTCFVTIYVDGVRVYDASMTPSPANDMGRLPTTDFAAAEFYGGGAILPAGISPTNSQCGTLVLYTRDR